MAAATGECCVSATAASCISCDTPVSPRAASDHCAARRADHGSLHQIFNHSGGKARLVTLAIHQFPPELSATQWGVRPDMLFRPQGGTFARVAFSVPQNVILGLDMASLQIDRYADDTGRELSTAVFPTPQYLVMSFPKPEIISADGHTALAQFSLNDAPSMGAARFLLQGAVPGGLASARKSLRKRTCPSRLAAF